MLLQFFEALNAKSQKGAFLIVRSNIKSHRHCKPCNLQSNLHITCQPDCIGDCFVPRNDEPEKLLFAFAVVIHLQITMSKNAVGEEHQQWQKKRMALPARPGD